MLATLCPLCECVELQDRQGAKYCVACQEVLLPFSQNRSLLNKTNYQVDCHETSKDNPALSQQAAIGVRERL